jgi:prepilin-type N-terminal cleavage/methylation domain-containing protein
MLYKYFNSKKGFTMMEILIVVIVLGILVAIAVPVFATGLRKQKEDDCRNQCLVIETAVKQAMFGMIDNGERQPRITFKCTTYSGDPLTGHSVVANDTIIGAENPEGEGYCFVLTDDPETCFTLAQLRGGYRPGTTAAFLNQGLDDYKAGCDKGYYLKKIKYQADNKGKGTPFYMFLDNQEVPVCPFADDDNTQGYYYYVVEDGSVHCTCALDEDK